jgi:hypothetical protein
MSKPRIVGWMVLHLKHEGVDEVVDSLKDALTEYANAELPAEVLAKLKRLEIALEGY